MITKKHFEAVAKILNDRQIPLDNANDQTIGGQNMRAELAHHLADLFANENPRFDHARFLTACGLGGK